MSELLAWKWRALDVWVKMWDAMNEQGNMKARNRKEQKHQSSALNAEKSSSCQNIRSAQHNNQANMLSV